MQINDFNTRKLAEAGAPMQILHPITGEPIVDEGGGCRVIVRGVASPSMQAMIRRRRAEKMRAREEAEDEEAQKNQVMEDIHLELCEAAAPYIAGFENVLDGDRHLTATPEDINMFLDLSFPEMGIKADENGEPIMRDAKDADGNDIQVPAFEVTNFPFAKQVADFAGRQANFLGNAKGD